MRAQEAKRFSNISATPANFTLLGGKYQLAVVATFGGGNVQLNQLGPDGATLLPVSTSVTAAGQQTLDLPPGTYQLTVTTATAVFATITRVPEE